MQGNLFTQDFLGRGITETAAWRELDDTTFAAVKAELIALYSAFPTTANPNEAETEDRLIYPICDVIGWTYRSVKQGLEAVRRNVPDALLFLAAEDRLAADHTEDQAEKIKYANAILEAKRWNVPFDRRVDRETAAPITRRMIWSS